MKWWLQSQGTKGCKCWSSLDWNRTWTDLWLCTETCMNCFNMNTQRCTLRIRCMYFVVSGGFPRGSQYCCMSRQLHIFSMCTICVTQLSASLKHPRGTNVLCHQFGMSKTLFLSTSLPSSRGLAPLHYCSFPSCCFLVHHPSLSLILQISVFCLLSYSPCFLSLHLPFLVLVSLRTDSEACQWKLEKILTNIQMGWSWHSNIHATQAVGPTKTSHFLYFSVYMTSSVVLDSNYENEVK